MNEAGSTRWGNMPRSFSSTIGCVGPGEYATEVSSLNGGGEYPPEQYVAGEYMLGEYAT